MKVKTKETTVRQLVNHVQENSTRGFKEFLHTLDNSIFDFKIVAVAYIFSYCEFDESQIKFIKSQKPDIRKANNAQKTTQQHSNYV